MDEFSNGHGDDLNSSSFHCINAYQDGMRSMDTATPLYTERLPHEDIESKIRPISGVRRHLNRQKVNNHISKNHHETNHVSNEIIRLISEMKTIKRLDLSNNELKKYPKKLCSLIAMESLNLSNNGLSENDFPAEIEHYTSLIELNMSHNELKKIPKAIATKCNKQMLRLNLSYNQLNELKFIDHFRLMRVLLLNNNSIGNMDELNVRHLSKLEVLDLKHNSIASVPLSLFKDNGLLNIRQLDLSFNKINHICFEIFKLPNLEILNLSNNHLSTLPTVAYIFERSFPITLLDLSHNSINRFYAYLLTISDNIDLCHNKIKVIPSKTILRLTNRQAAFKQLAIYENPMREPPLEMIESSRANGIRSPLTEIRDYFVDKDKRKQINKGFKITLIGSARCGKTSLAYALEDHNCKTNLVEEFFMGSENDPHAAKPSSEDIHESKFFEINDFFFEINEVNKETPQPPPQQPVMPKKGGGGSNHKPVIFNNGNPRTPIKLVESELPEKLVCPIHIYDFNFHNESVCHLLSHFLDKNSIILLCLDSRPLHELLTTGANAEFKKNLFNLLDALTLRMSKSLSYVILPVVTKCDLIDEGHLSDLLAKTRSLLDTYVRARLTQFGHEIKKIESLPKINASQSDRLKHLIQMRTFVEPYIYKTCVGVSSLKFEGIAELSATIRDIIRENPKRSYQLIDRKVPTFWLEVEKYAMSHLADLPAIKNENGNIRIINNLANEQDLSILCLDASSLKEKIVKKFGMRHLVDQILSNMSSSGKIVWFHDNEKLKQKVFFRPAVLFDLYFSLFRSNFSQNFLDATINSIRTKLISPTSKILSKENIEHLTDDFLNRGILHIDLLKLLWYPVLLINSVKILRDIAMLFMDFFMLFYPLLPKDKLKQVMNTYVKMKTDVNPEFQDDSQVSIKFCPADPNEYTELNMFIVPFYLPATGEEFILRTQSKLDYDCQTALNNGLVRSFFLDSESLFPLRLATKYTFTAEQTILKSVFMKFAVNCVLNSDLYYKAHFNNMIYAQNEENSLGFQQIEEGFEASESFKKAAPENAPMVLNIVWVLALRVMQLFEETIHQMYPCLSYERWCMCPSCHEFSFPGEWLTPKELQKLKTKQCGMCSAMIDYAYLVKPMTSSNISLDIKRLQQRLNALTIMVDK